MKKPKVKLDGAQFKKFLVHHVEKFVLVGVLGVMAWLVYQGYSLPGLDPGKTPEGLKKASVATRTFIDDPTRWTVVKGTRPVPPDLQQLVDQVQLDSDPTKYRLPLPWNPPHFPKLSPREDPKLFVPERLIAIPVVGPINSYPTTETDLDPLEPIPVEEDEDAPKKPVRPKARPTRAGVSADPYGMMAGGMMEGTETPQAMGRRPGRGGGKAGARSGGSSSGALSSAMSGESMGDMMGMSGQGYGGQVAGGINPESILGYQASDGLARHLQAIVIKAVVPYEKQVEEFERALGSSLDYEFSRDQVLYLKLRVERAEVPEDNLAADPQTLAWKGLNVNAATVEQVGDIERGIAGEWAATLNEVVDPAYLDPRLTHPAPPLMQRDTWPLLTHPDVPLSSMGVPGEYGETEFPATPAGQTEGPVNDDPTLFQGQGGFGGSSGLMPGTESGGMSGMGSGYGRRGSMPGSGSSGGMRPSMPRGGSGASMGSGSSMGSMGMSGSQMGSRMGSMGMSGSSMGSMGMGDGMSGYDNMVAPATFKMIRFTDTHVDEGKHYRYRLKVVLRDPNHPPANMVPPTLASLHEDVRARLKTVDAADAKKGPTTRTFWVESDWSEPSDVVALPSMRHYYAGSVVQPASTIIFDKKPKVPNDQPSATVLTSVWDPTKVVDVPTEKKVYRGSILNFIEDAQVIHPVSHTVVDLEKYRFTTDAIVADVMGGETIPSRDRTLETPLKVPGEVLIVDAAGNLHVQHEASDIEEFRRLLVPKADPAKPAGAMPGMPAMNGEDGYGGLMQPPSMGPPTGGRRPRGARGSSSGSSSGP